MTAKRRRRNFLHRFAILLATIAAAAGLSPAIRAATTEQIVVDPNSGLAISGFDPVVYFIIGAALPGKDRIEHAFAGAVWRFRNEGNRAAFIADPEFYMPRFGGYDPIGVARGVAVPGDPRRFLVASGRLYLFYTAEARETFAGDPERIAAAAEKEWPAVQSTLAP
jgi:hypothetical protein